MSRDTAEVASVRDLNSEGEGTQAKLFNDAYDKKSAANGGENVAVAPQPEVNARGGVVARDAQGRITRVDYPDGVTYEYSKFDAQGNPANMKITDHKDGDFGQWKKESDGLWRAYNKDKPSHEVVEGEWKVDDQGVMRMHGQQDTRPLPPKENKGYTEQAGTKITRDAQGRITSSQDTHGVKYEYSGFDAEGQPTSVKITQRGHKDYGEWKKQPDGKWLAYSNGKPSSQEILGEWRVNEKGELRRVRQEAQPAGSKQPDEAKPVARDVQKVADPPPAAPVERSSFQAPPEARQPERNERGGVVARDANGRVTRVDYADGVTYEFGKFDEKGNPTRIKITSQDKGTFGQWNKEADGLWRAYSGDKPNLEVLEGEMRVDNQGIVHRDGKQAFRDRPAPENKGYTEQPSPKLTRDGAGNISSVEHPNGVKYEFRGHDANGQPTSVKITQRGHKDFGEWKKERDGLWRAYDNGKPTSEVIVGEWRVNEKGEMTHTGHQDMQPLSRSSSETTTERARESHARPAKVAEKPAAPAEELKSEFFVDSGHMLTRYPDGKLAAIERGNGEVTRFKYTDGKLSEVTLPGGTVMTTTDGKSWKDSKTGESSELKIDVKDDGTYSVEKGGKKAVLLPNGCTVRSEVVSGSPDRVTSVTYADGENASFKYGADGKLNEVAIPGAVYKTTDGKMWTSSQGGEPFEAKVSVNPSGNYTIERDGKRSTMETDGILTKADIATGRNALIFPNGTVRHFDGKDSVFPSKVTTPDGRDVKVNESTAGEYEIKSGDSLSAIARDLLEANNINVAGYKPSNAEVTAAIDTLVKANKMASKTATIRPGQKLIIPRELAS